MVVKMHCLIWLLRGIYIKENLYLGLVFSDLYSETVPGSSPAAAYVQRWALCSNRPAYVQVSVKRVEVVERTQRNSLPLTQLPCKLWMFVKENMDRKKKVPWGYVWLTWISRVLSARESVLTLQTGDVHPLPPNSQEIK